MPYFSDSSIAQLQTCDISLQRILCEAIKHVDFTVVCGHRNKQDQDKAVREGKSKLHWPESKHNSLPSKAVDIAPYHPDPPHIDWNDREGFIFLAGMIKGIACHMGYKIRWGGDWDGDNDQRDEKGLSDLPHIELVE